MKEMVKAISFDIWETLLKNNPDSGEKKADCIMKKFNHYRISKSNILTMLTKVKNVVNNMVRLNPNFCYQDILYVMILSNMGYSNIRRDLIDFVKEEFTKIFEENPPLLIDPDTKIILEKLSKEYLLFITSNTLFISGSSIRNFLNLSGIMEYFKFAIFSDEVGMNKPSPDIFALMSKICNNIQGDITPSNILHIGDSDFYDGACKIHGINFIKKEDSLSETLKQLL